MNYLNESLAHESGLELDGLYADNNNLTKSDFQFQCAYCDYIGTGEDFKDTEYDGDIIGLCPNCKEHRILIDLNVEAQYENRISDAY